MTNLINTLKNNDLTTNIGLGIVTLIIVPLLITVLTNIDSSNLF